MAILKDEDDKNKENNVIGSQNTQNLGAQTPGIGAAPAQPKGTSSGRFSNIQNFIRANQGNQLGSNINNRIGGAADVAKQQVGKERNAFQQKTTEAFKPFAGGQQFAQNTIYNPTQALQDDATTGKDEGAENLQRFKTISQGQYSGPMGLANLDQLKAGVQNVQGLAGLTGNEGGRRALLQSFYGRPTYTAGQQSLDNLLLQADPRQLKQLAASRSTAAGAGRTMNLAEQQSFGEGASKATEAKSLGNYATKTLGKEQTTRDKELADKLSGIKQEELDRQKSIERVKSDLAQNRVSYEDAKRLGIPEFDELYGVNLGNYLKTNLQKAPETVAEVASRDEAARVNALQRLAGGAGNIFDLDKVNTYKPSTQSFNTDAMGDLQREIARRKAEADVIKGRYNALRQVQAGLNPETRGGAMSNPGGFVDAARKAGIENIDNTINSWSSGSAANPSAYNMLTAPSTEGSLNLKGQVASRENEYRNVLQAYGINPDNYQVGKLSRYNLS